MPSKLNKPFFVWILFLFCQTALLSQNFGLRGMLSGWITVNTDKANKPQIGLRYIPEFSLEKSLSQKYTFDIEFSLNAYGTGQVHSLDDIRTDGEVKPYRMWLRFSSSQFEARLGLQKINFGSALLLRPLMWFDRIDPRDPLQLTDGVYGLLLRYYFLNNANIWLWGLYGNDDLKGWESMSSHGKSIEFGGRFQAPLGNGELGFTYHRRQIEVKGLLQEVVLDKSLIPENRYALDGKWDIGIGLWFEASLIHQHSESLPFSWQRALNIGMDYTFSLGNGLNVIGEYFIFESSMEAFGSGEGIEFSALSLNYPLSILDNINCILYYDWDNDDLYSFVNWRRTYDKWIINVIGFWNPERFQIYQAQPGNNLFAGKGIQIMVVFNY